VGADQGGGTRPLLINAEADLAIGSFPGVVPQLREGQQKGLSLHHQRLYSGEPVCIMRRGHPLAGQDLTIDGYCDALHVLVSFSGSPSGPADDKLASLGRSRRIALTVNQFATMFHMVARSDLLCIVPRHLTKAYGMAENIVVKTLPFQLPIVYVDMLWHDRDTLRPAHKWLRETIMEIPAVSEHEG
jgi:DNA-binding transcriptional LysR family regulator